MAGRLAGKRILITAAGQGMGRATALICAAEGARLLATDRDAGLLAGQMQDHPPRLCPLVLHACKGRFQTPIHYLPLVLDHRLLLLVCHGRKTTPSKANGREL